LALWNASDQWHDAAAEAHRHLIARGVPVVTTTLVLLECGNRVARCSDFRELVAAFRDDIKAAEGLIRPEPADEATAWDAYRRGEAGQAGIVDHLSFVVMRRLGLSQAFTNDAHFRAAGFEPLF
jgi:predicted nucleic acid-binding protein